MAEKEKPNASIRKLKFFGSLLLENSIKLYLTKD
jgi:hypothetical protein